MFTNDYGKLNGMIYYICYLFPNLISMWETTLILKLINSIQKKFLSINNLIKNRKQQYKKLRKVFPHGQNIFNIRNINNTVQTHYNTTMISTRINELFEFPTLLTLATNFQSITFVFRHITLIVETVINTTAFFMATAAILWMVTLGTQTVLIVKGFDNLEREVMH